MVKNQINIHFILMKILNMVMKGLKKPIINFKITVILKKLKNMVKNTLVKVAGRC